MIVTPDPPAWAGSTRPCSTGGRGVGTDWAKVRPPADHRLAFRRGRARPAELARCAGRPAMQATSSTSAPATWRPGSRTPSRSEPASRRTSPRTTCGCSSTRGHPFCLLATSTGPTTTRPPGGHRLIGDVPVVHPPPREGPHHVPRRALPRLRQGHLGRVRRPRGARPWPLSRQRSLPVRRRRLLLVSRASGRASSAVGWRLARLGSVTPRPSLWVRDGGTKAAERGVYRRTSAPSHAGPPRAAHRERRVTKATSRSRRPLRRRSHGQLDDVDGPVPAEA